MTDGTGIGAFEQEFADFNHRVTALRAARADSPDVLDAAFLELELAQEMLRVARGELTGQSQVSRPSDAADRERSLLRAVFGELPVPVFVLDHGGFIRRANGAAAELLGTSTAYTAGKPFPVFVDLAARAAFRSQLSAVLRGAGPASFGSVVLADRQRLRSRLMLARVALASEDRPVVVVAVVPSMETVPQGRTAAGPVNPVATIVKGEPAALRRPGLAPEEDALAAAVRRADLLSQVSRLLLDEQSLSEPVTLHRIAWLLQASSAEWVIIDLARGEGTTRAVVAGPDLPPQPLVAGDVHEPAPLHTQVLASGKAVLQPVIADENALGLATTGSPVLTVLGAGSVLCVPMRAGGSTAGVLTLIRPPEQRPFSLSDLRIFEEIGEHLALALHNGRRYQRRSDTAAALRASLLPHGPVEMPGLDWAAAYRSGTEGVEVGGDFYDLFRSPGGWGVVLGDVCGKGEESAAVTAMVRHGIRLLSLWDNRPAQVLAKVNTAMLAQQETDRFVTAVAAHLCWQQESLVVELASAGHPAAAVVRASGTVSFGTGGGLPLGLFTEGEAKTERLLMQPGDTLVLYSDGVTERHAADGSPYGTTRLGEVLARSLGEPATAVVRAIEDDLNAFSQGAPYRDDVAILAVRVQGVPDGGPGAG